jgi:hypothetical protein
MTTNKTEYMSYTKDLPTQIIETIKGFEGVNTSNASLNILKRYLKNTTTENPISIIFPSCPDFSCDPNTGKCDYKGLSSGIPTTAKTFIENGLELTELFHKQNIPFICEILIADKEAYDPLTKCYTNNNSEDFLTKCTESRVITQEYLNEILQEKNLPLNKFVVNGFLEKLPQILTVEDEYQQLIRKLGNYALSCNLSSIKS